MAEGMLGTQDRDMARMYQQVASAVNQYHGNPAMFTEAQVKQLKAAADSMGIAMSVSFSPGRAFKKGLYELGEGLTFGLLPNRWDPGALNTGEDIAGGIGGLLGLAMPVGAGVWAGGKALQGAQRLAVRGSTLFPVKSGLHAAIKGMKKSQLQKALLSAVKGANKVAAYPGVRKALGTAAGWNVPFTNINAIRGAGVGLGLLNRDILGESNPDDVMELQ